MHKSKTSFKKVEVKFSLTMMQSHIVSSHIVTAADKLLFKIYLF